MGHDLVVFCGSLEPGASDFPVSGAFLRLLHQAVKVLTRGTAAPFVPGAVAELSIFDFTGRRLATVRGPSGTRLIWDGRTSNGVRAATGIYLWRMEVRDQRQEGKLVVVR